MISPRNTKVYYLSQLFHSLIFSIPIWIVYYLGIVTISQVSFLVTLQYLVQILLELPSGALADLIGRRNTNLVGFFMGALSYIFLPFANNFWHLALLLFLVGASDSFRSGSEEALVYDTFKQDNNETEFAKVYANGQIIYQAGLIIATALGGLMYEYHRFFPFILYGLSLLLGTITVAFYIEPKIDSAKFTFKNYYQQIILGAKEAFSTKYSKYLSLFYVLVGGIAWSSTLYFNEFMMVDLGFSSSIRGYLTAVMRLLNVIFIAKLLNNSRLFNFRRTILFFPWVMLLGYLPGKWLSGYSGLPFVQLAMIATTARWIILTPLTNQVFSSKYRATAISFLSLLIGVVYITLTSISGPVITMFGVKTMYTILGIATLITVVPLTSKLLALAPIKS